MTRRLGASPDAGLDLTGAVAMDHAFRVGVIHGRRDGHWFGSNLDHWADPSAHWRWTSVSPVVIAADLREYAEATDDLLGIANLREGR